MDGLGGAGAEAGEDSEKAAEEWLRGEMGVDEGGVLAESIAAAVREDEVCTPVYVGRMRCVKLCM